MEEGWLPHQWQSFPMRTCCNDFEACRCKDGRITMGKHCHKALGKLCRGDLDERLSCEWKAGFRIASRRPLMTEYAKTPGKAWTTPGRCLPLLAAKGFPLKFVAWLLLSWILQNDTCNVMFYICLQESSEAMLLVILYFSWYTYSYL